MIQEASNNMIDLPNGRTLNSLIANNGKIHETFVPTFISHEVPVSMLEMSRAFNDYDYALVHLFKDYPEYFEFFVKSIAMGRRVILDNSLYELGKAFDMEEYAHWIKALQPTYYIIPDTFWDSKATIEQAMEWMTGFGKNIDPKIKKIGVAQGSTYAEIKNTYRFLSAFCDCIAFTFKFAPTMMDDPDLKLSIFLDKLQVRYPGITVWGKDLTIEDKHAACRYLVLKKLDDDGIIDHTKEHHLLGLQNTTLLYEACRFPWVTSIDTSNPVIHGFRGNAYYFNETITSGASGCDISHGFIGNSGHPKPKEQLKDYFHINPADPLWSSNINIVLHNIRAFRDIVNPTYLSAIFYGHRNMNDDYIADNVKEFYETNRK